MRIGFHFPFSGGLIKLKNRISSSRGNTYQIFARGLRGGELKELHEQRLQDLIEFQKRKNIAPSIIHAPYVYNLANLSNGDELKVLEDLEYAKQFKAPYYVLNPGRYTENHPLEALENVKYQLWDLMNKTDWLGEILIKNTRGSGTELAYDLRDWRELVLFHPQIKGALDLGRLNTAGYDFKTKEKAEYLVEAIDEYIGWENIKVLYINDTNEKLGSRREDKKPPPLGEGTIGFNGYREILSLPVIKEKIWIVENSPTPAHYARSLDYLLTFFD